MAWNLFVLVYGYWPIDIPIIKDLNCKVMYFNQIWNMRSIFLGTLNAGFMRGKNWQKAFIFFVPDISAIKYWFALFWNKRPEPEIDEQMLASAVVW